MVRWPLAALAVALASPAAVASPTPPTECATYLLAAPSGATASCGTLGNPHLSGAYDTRTLRLTVLNGGATATLTCYGTDTPPVTVVLDGPGTATRTLRDSGFCFADLRATAPGTTAVATNTSSYELR